MMLNQYVCLSFHAFNFSHTFIAGMYDRREDKVNGGDTMVCNSSECYALLTTFYWRKISLYVLYLLFT